MAKIFSVQGPYPGSVVSLKRNEIIIEFPTCEPQLFIKGEEPYGLGVNHQNGKRYFIGLQGTKKTKGLPELLVLSPGGPKVSSTKSMTREDFELCKELFLNNVDTRQVLLDNLSRIEKVFA